MMAVEGKAGYRPLGLTSRDQAVDDVPGRVQAAADDVATLRRYGLAEFCS